jgi:hypothetical protein
VQEGGETLGEGVSDLEGSVFLPTGIPAAGKSTVADRLARPFARSVRVRGDDFRRMVVSGRVASHPSRHRTRGRSFGCATVKNKPDEKAEVQGATALCTGPGSLDSFPS